MECLRDFRSCDRMSSPRASFAIHPLLVPKPVAACHVVWRGDPERRGRLSRSATDRLSGSPALTRTRCFGWLAGSPSRSGEHTCRDLVCPKHDSGRRESGSEPGPRVTPTPDQGHRNVAELLVCPRTAIRRMVPIDQPLTVTRHIRAINVSSMPRSTCAPTSNSQHAIPLRRINLCVH